jgi:hypothetical protein
MTYFFGFISFEKRGLNSTRVLKIKTDRLGKRRIQTQGYWTGAGGIF